MEQQTRERRLDVRALISPAVSEDRRLREDHTVDKWIWIVPIAVASAVFAGTMVATPQNRPTDSNPKRLIEKADRLAWLYNWYLAGPLYAEAETLYELSGDSRNALYAKIGHLRSTWETMSFPEVSEYLETILDSPIVENDPQLRLWLLDAKGSVDLEVNIASARQSYEEAREIARQVGDKAREARASGELGIISFLEGGAGDSITLLSDALKTSIELKDVGAHIRYLNLLGNGLNLFGRPEDAIRYFDRALQLVRNTPELDTSTMAIAGKAQALMALNKRSEAEKLLQDNLDRARLRNRNGLAAYTLVALGNIAKDAGERDLAISRYEEAVKLAQTAELHRLVAIAMFGLAHIYQKVGDIENAEDRAAKGIEASQKVGERYEMPQRMALLAKLQADRAKFVEADRLYEQAEDLVDGLLVGVTSPNARTSLVGAMSQIYLDHFGLAVDSLNNPSRAFEVLERARGRTAADVLRNRDRRPTVSRSRTAHEREIARLQIQLMRASSKGERNTILEKLFDEEQGLTGEQLHPLPRLMGQGQPVELTVLQRKLSPDEVILEYALGELRSHCLVIDSNGIHALTLADAGQIEVAVDTYLSQVRARKPATQSAKLLYKLLLGPVPQDLLKPRLTIVVDGRLHLLPFDALIDGKGEYVLANHTVTYEPSATVHDLLRSSAERVKTTVPLLAVGDVPYSESGNLIAIPKGNSKAKLASGVKRGLYDLRGERLPRLPGTGEEVKAIAAIAGSGSIVLTGAEATETRFRSQPLESVRAIHLAVHGVSSSTSPDRAALVLGRFVSDEDDGLLQSREIAELNLPAELVALSACDTGAGKLVGQEGIVNLVRAFLFAGSRTVVASLWSADDAFTTSLMKRFYENLAKGTDRGLALRRAKLSLVEQFGPDAVPFLWAGFTMTGEGLGAISFLE